MGEERLQLLWLDDEIDMMSEYVDALRRHGIDVTPAKDAASALRHLAKAQYQVILSDVRMRDPNGIEFLKKAHQLQKKARFAALSSYLYLRNYRDDLLNIGFEVQPIDKQAVPPDSQEFVDLLVEPLIALARSGASDSIARQDARAKESEFTNPFSVALSEYLRLSVVEKDRLSKLAGEMAQSTLDGAFARGLEWVLLCGSSSKIRKSGSAADPPLANEEAMDVAAKHDRAPFLFCRGYHTEDLASTWGECGASCSFRWYPTVRLAVADETLDIHFDTGSPTCLLSYEELLRLKVVEEPLAWANAMRAEGEADYQCIGIKLEDVYVHSQSDTQKKLVTIRGQAVRDWWSTCFVRECHEPCERYSPRPESGQCPERRGMIGRTFLTDNGLSLILDGQEKTTGIRGEDAPD